MLSISHDFGEIDKDWRVGEKFKFHSNLRYAYRKNDSTLYLCDEVLYGTFSKIKIYFQYEVGFNTFLPLLPIFEVKDENNRKNIFYKKIPLLIEVGNFNTKKILDTIIIMEKFNYEMDYSMALSYIYSLFVKDEKILIIPSSISASPFSEKVCLYRAARLFNKLNEKKISDEFYLLSNNYIEGEGFEKLKKTILSVID